MSMVAIWDEVNQEVNDVPTESNAWVFGGAAIGHKNHEKIPEIMKALKSHGFTVDTSYVGVESVTYTAGQMNQPQLSPPQSGKLEEYGKAKKTSNSIFVA